MSTSQYLKIDSTVQIGFLSSECDVKTHLEKITHFDNVFQSALNLVPNQRTRKKIKVR